MSLVGILMPQCNACYDFLPNESATESSLHETINKVRTCVICDVARFCSDKCEDRHLIECTEITYQPQLRNPQIIDRLINKHCKDMFGSITLLYKARNSFERIRGGANSIGPSDLSVFIKYEKTPEELKINSRDYFYTVGPYNYSWVFKKNETPPKLILANHPNSVPIEPFVAKLVNMHSQGLQEAQNIIHTPKKLASDAIEDSSTADYRNICFTDEDESTEEEEREPIHHPAWRDKKTPTLILSLTPLPEVLTTKHIFAQLAKTFSENLQSATLKIKTSYPPFVYLKLDDITLKELFASFKELKAQKPPFIELPPYYPEAPNPFPDPIGGHITVISGYELKKSPQKKQILKTIETKSLGKSFKISLEEIIGFYPEHWTQVCKAWAVVFSAPDLESFRTSHGFTNLPNGHKFHATFATRPWE